MSKKRIYFQKEGEGVYETTQQVKLAGCILTMSKYGKPIFIGKRNFIEIDLGDGDEENKIKLSAEEMRLKSLRRAKKRITDLINANFRQWKKRGGIPYEPYTFTFTFGENVQDLDYANKELKNFIRRFGYSIRGKITFFKYLAVIEFQKRGAIHYHVVIFNLPWVDDLYDEARKIWRQSVGSGAVHIEPAASERGTANYLCKYLTKSVENDRLETRKSYFCSKGLKKPITISFEELVNLIKTMLPPDLKGYFRHSESDHLVYINRTIYNLKKYPEILERIHKEIIEKYL